MPFFIRKNAGKKNKNTVKRKREQKPNVPSKKIPTRNGLQEEITSDEELSGVDEDAAQYSSEEEETFQEKRLRLTKKYIQKIANEEKEKADLTEVSNDVIARRLREEVLEEAGRLQKKRADEFKECEPEILKIFRGHKLSITCLVISSDENYVFSASKDYSIIKWSIKEAKKIKAIPGILKKTEKNPQPGHSAHVLSMAISSDDKFLATGCRDNIINIWNPENMDHLKIFRGHKDAVTGLTFSRGSHQLISASSDRSVKVWNLDEMGYVETLFGHQDGVTSIDSFLGETAITAGGRDNTIRIWKIIEESQLVYQGHGASIDCICVTSKDNFVSGADDGSLSLWGVRKKKPLFKVPVSHGHDPETEEPFWITSLCALQNTEVIASGSQDGFIRLWMRDDENHKILPIKNIPVEGFVNSLKFSSSGKYLVAGIGQEHRFGRWWRRKEAKNSIVIYAWKNKS